MSDGKIELSEEQKNILNLTEGKHLILAPPGTGKTELLSYRVQSALNNGCNAGQMICLTFTNRAAKNMRDRILQTRSNKIFIGNIHNFCSKFLFKNKLISQQTSLLDEEDSALLLREAKEAECCPDKHTKEGEILRLNSYLKQKQLGFPDNVLLLPTVEITRNNILQNVCRRYEQLKSESYLLDFDDLLTYTYYHLLCGNGELTRYNWIQVDEVQDLNPLQWEIINSISSRDAHKVFFGDYEQAIFSFMGARVEKLRSISGECQVHNLQKNFRSPSYLLNIFIDFAKAHLDPQWDKLPVPSRTLGADKTDLMIYHITGNEAKETIYIVENIIPFLLPGSSGQTAILLRKNDPCDFFSNILTQKGIEHFKISGFDLFRRKLVKDVMAFLGCLSDRADRVSWFRLLTLFGKIPTLKEARQFVNSMFNCGLYPSDFLNENFFSSPLVISDFISKVKSERTVIVDTETTGLDLENDEIIQIAAVEIISGAIGRTFEVFLKTDRPLGESEEVHHISKEYLDKKGIERKEAFKHFLKFLGSDTLIAHNLSYDWNILRNNILRENFVDIAENVRHSFDTVDLCKRVYPKLNSYRLKDLISYLKIEGKNSHDALDDVKATANLVLSLYCESLKVEDVQVRFIEDNKKVINALQYNLGPYWLKLQSMMKEETSLPNVIESFINLLNAAGSYTIEAEDLKHLGKLKRHMQLKIGRKKLHRLLEEHLPEYRTYKENDLLVGDEKIVISTIHKAKGLEFENVIIPQCVDDMFPFYNSKTEEEITEDARCLYVALSRAKKRIIITTHSMTKTRYGYLAPKRPSEFLASIEKHFTKVNIKHY